MSSHVFLLQECHWTNNPEVDPDIREVCVNCGLDRKLGDITEPCETPPPPRKE
jgi:hypothetical protein